jgi:hypothetical protein
MKYTQEQVLDILKLVTKDPQSILDKWSNKKDNEYLDLTKYKYPLFLYSFPIIVNEEEVATLTLAKITNTGVDNQIDMLMSKYLTTETYNNSWFAYSHESYLHSYLTIHKEFKLPTHPEDDGFFVYESTFVDNKGKVIKYRMSYGDTEIEGLYEQWVDDSRWGNWRCYRFDNGVNIQIETIDIDGWEMGEKINEVIKVRLRDINIEEIVDEIKA